MRIKLPSVQKNVNDFIDIMEVEFRKGLSYEDAIAKASAPYTVQEREEMAEYITKRIERLRR